MTDTFSIGEQVISLSFRGVAEVLGGPNQRSEYLLQVGALKLWISGTKIEKLKRSDSKKKKQIRSAKGPRATSEATHSLDLHGFTTRQAEEALEAALDRALLEGAASLRIVHGLGTGSVKRSVHQYLSKSRHVHTFKLDDSNPGVTWVYF